MDPEMILSDLIKIDSANPPGNELAVARYLKELFDRAGILNQIIETSDNRGNFVARLGEGKKKLLYLSHTDVVPVADGWDFEPFSGAIEGGMVYGRGALDCKSLVAAEAYAMLSLAADGGLEGTLIFAATADEEKGGEYGIRYLIEHHRDLIKADFAVNEGGEEPLLINGRAVYFIQVGEKGTAWSRLTAKGFSCHGSVPALGDNAVVKMAGAVQRLARYKPAVCLIPEVKELLKELALLQELEPEVEADKVDLLLDRFADKDLAEVIRAMTRMTVSPNVIQGGIKTNVVPDSCWAEVDVRIMPGQDKEYVLAELRRCVGEEIDIDPAGYHPPSFSGADTEYFHLMESAIRELTGAAAVLPHLSPGATDSRFLREAGIPAYGIAVMAPDFNPALRVTIHGKNERIDVKSVRMEAEFLKMLAKKYLV
jgi:acetylornithine deacetylase/succinyl-diaminopimelate desuccinylase-like protein